ncbi:MAG: Glycogen synthase [Anaerolineales bacterium]|nr:Glycogen synthase [Anaerolineales bacterium]
MRICRIARIYPRTTSPGSGLMAYKLSEYLPHPCLYVAKQLDGTPLPFPSHVRLLLIDYPEPRSSKTGRFAGLRTAVASLGRIIGNLWLAILGLPHIWRFRPDILHVHTPLPLLLGIFAKLTLHCPLVLSFHGTDYYRFRNNRFLVRLAGWFVDHVICIAPGMKTELENLLPGAPVSYFPNGVDLDLFSPDSTIQKKKQIVSVGRLFWQKGYPDLLSAIMRVFEKDPTYTMVIVGDGPLRAELEEIVARARLQERVEFTGVVSQAQVVRILRESELFVMASVSEGFPKALIEAMACGLPVVTTRVGACEDVVKEAQCGIVVQPNAPDHLAGAIYEILASPALRQRYASQAVLASRKYAWQDQAEKVARLYKQLLSVSTPLKGKPQ